MVRVKFLGPIGRGDLELDVTSLEELKSELAKVEDVASWLGLSAIAINDVMCEDLRTPLKDGDEVVLLPPVCGG